MKKQENKEIETVVTENELIELNAVDTLDAELVELNGVNDSVELNDTEAEKEEIETGATTTKKEKFLNPFEVGVTYVEFQKALGEKSIAEYCKGKLEKEQIEFLEKELTIINKK